MKKAYVKYLIIAACCVLVAAVVAGAVLLNKFNTADNGSVGTSSNSSENSVLNNSSVSESSDSSDLSSSDSSSEQIYEQTDPKVTVPSVENVTFEQAKASLAGLSLSYSSSEAFSDSVEAGKVVSQSVKGGEAVAIGTEIHIVISKGPDLVQIPDAQGKSLSEANKLFSEAGLKLVTDIKCSDSVKEGIIISQDATPGNKVKRNSTVSAYVSAGVSNTVGNTSANSSQFGVVASQGNWIYYCNWNSDYYLYKMRHDGTQKQLLSEDVVGNVNVVGEWVYYTRSITDGGGVYKIKLDGSDKTKINSGENYWLYVADGWVYYSDLYYSGNIYRMRTDGSDVMKISSDKCADINVVGDWIYYVNQNDSIVYKMRTDGTEKSILHSQFRGYGLIVDNNTLFINSTYSGYCYKINADSTGFQTLRLDDKQISFANANGGWLYFLEHDFSSSATKLAFYKMRLDGTQKTKIFDQPSVTASNYYINVIGDWIYFPNKNDNGYLYRVKTDGTNLQKVHK